MQLASAAAWAKQAGSLQLAPGGACRGASCGKLAPSLITASGTPSSSRGTHRVTVVVVGPDILFEQVVEAGTLVLGENVGACCCVLAHALQPPVLLARGRLVRAALLLLLLGAAAIHTAGAGALPAARTLAALAPALGRCLPRYRISCCLLARRRQLLLPQLLARGPVRGAAPRAHSPVKHPHRQQVLVPTWRAQAGG